MMQHRRHHLTSLTRRPAQAQTVQELKYETLIVYIHNAGLLLESGWFPMAAVIDVFGELGASGNIPYKSFFGGGSGSGGGGTS